MPARVRTSSPTPRSTVGHKPLTERQLTNVLTKLTPALSKIKGVNGMGIGSGPRITVYLEKNSAAARLAIAHLFETRAPAAKFRIQVLGVIRPE